MTNPNDRFDLLQKWKVEVTPPDNFQSEVWQRIAARTPEHRGFLPFAEAWEAFASKLLRPQWAAALVTLSIAAGLGFGELAAHHDRSEALAELQTRYVRLINPLTGVSLALK